MIIVCKACNSAFRVDDRLIKPTGTRVRCSKCSYLFVAYKKIAFERRKHQRIKTQNLISHLSFDETGTMISEGIGKAVDISKGGMLLETPYHIEAGKLSLMAVDLENNLVEIEGKVIYTKKTFTGMYQSGIKFMVNNGQVDDFIVKLVKEYIYLRRNLFIRWYKHEPMRTPPKAD